MSSVLKPGNTAVITGASSGIGRAAALDFASRGMNVWMIDIDAEELKEATAFVKKEQSGSASQTIEGRVVDVSDEQAMKDLAEEVFAEGGKCHFLFNNAAVQLSVPEEGILAPTAKTAMKSTVDVNLYGPIHGCLAFVPRMKEQGEEAIVVNTGSKQGITMPPGNLPYNVSKAALKCYTEGLEHDLRNSDGNKVRSALLVPGWVNTSIMLKNSRKEALERGEDFDPDSVFFHEGKPASGAWMPKQLIDFMVDELDEGKFYLIAPDNDVDRETDNLRMTWTMQDITMDRPPLSRWHEDYKDKFTVFLNENKTKS
jgi:NAD(P)-dependent dehydrogenase (short-subunit alcohol dehydrogenase family)